MSNLFWLTEMQMARLSEFLPGAHGRPRVDDRRVLSGINHVNRNGLRWRDAPAAYGPHQTLYTHWRRWCGKGVFAQMLVGLARQSQDTDTLMMDVTHLKTHRTAASLRGPPGHNTWRRRLIGRARAA